MTEDHAPWGKEGVDVSCGKNNFALILVLFILLVIVLVAVN
ncbi:YjcZ family sporulation protein [Brevibacillus sp. GCM10020057]